VIYDLGQQTSSDASYTKVLPSLNFSYWAIPQELQLRVGIAETMSRPNLNQLAPNSTNGALGGRPEIYYSGTVGLKPITAWQGDLSAEWYYHPHAALTLAYFEKHVSNDIYTGATTGVDLGTKLYVGGPPGSSAVTSVRDFPWTTYAPANGVKETYRGVELAWQHLLENGFGAHVQVTHTYSSADAVNTAPPTTASIGVLYEKGAISADVNWDYTSSYKSVCAQCTEVSGWPVYSDSFQWLTASLHYKFFANFDVYVEGRNLTDAIARSYLNNNPNLVWANGMAVGQSASGVGFGYTAYGRTYVLGLAYRF
jgi:iron complex outermembrane recepter protein